MDKQDWIDLFEAINSRTPTKEEIDNARKIGEFTEPVETETTSEPQVVREESTEIIADSYEENITSTENIDEPSHPVADTPSMDNAENQEAIHGEGRSRLNSNEPSIENTGHTSYTTDSNAYSNNEAPYTTRGEERSRMNNAELKQSANNYFTWLLETVKHPASKASGYITAYSWITMGLVSFFISLTVTLNLNGMLRSFGLGYGSAYMSRSPIGFATFLMLFISVSILILVFTFATWVGLQILGNKVTFSSVVDQYAGFYTPVIVLTACASLFSLIRLNSIGSICLSLAVLILSISLYFILFNSKSTLKIDGFYARVLVVFVVTAILSVAVMLLITFLSMSVLASLF